MPKILPPDTEAKGILCRLEGIPRKKASHQIGISETKLQQIWNRFRDRIGQAKYDALSQFGEILNQKGLSFFQWTDEFCFRKRFENLGIKIDTNLDSFVDELYLVCKENQISLTEIVNEILELRKLSKQLDVPLGKITSQISKEKSELDNTRSQKQQLLQENSNIKKEIQESKKDLEDTLTESKVTKKQLIDFNQTKESLKEGFSDLGKLEKTLEEVKGYGWNSKDIHNDLSRSKSLKQHIAQQELQEKKNQEIISKQNQFIKEQQNTINSNNSKIQTQNSQKKELEMQTKKIYQGMEISKELFETKVSQFEKLTQNTLQKIQDKNTAAIEQATVKGIESQQEMAKKYQREFQEIIEMISNSVQEIAKTAQNVASLKAIQPLYKLLCLNATTLEAIEALILPVTAFLIIYENDPRSNSIIKRYAKELQRSLQGDLKRRFK